LTVFSVTQLLDVFFLFGPIAQLAEQL